MMLEYRADGMLKHCRSLKTIIRKEPTLIRNKIEYIPKLGNIFFSSNMSFSTCSEMAKSLGFPWPPFSSLNFLDHAFMM